MLAGVLAGGAMYLALRESVFTAHDVILDRINPAQVFSTVFFPLFILI
jgi:hypothetical protein